MPDADVRFNIPTPSVKVEAVTKSDVIAAIQNTNQISGESKEVALDLLDKHSADSFHSMSELLGVGFPPEVIEALQLCNEVVQLFVS